MKPRDRSDLPLVAWDAGGAWRAALFFIALSKGGKEDVWGRVRGPFGYYDREMEGERSAPPNARIAITHLPSGTCIGRCAHEAGAERVIDDLMALRDELAQPEARSWYEAMPKIKQILARHQVLAG